MLLSVIIPFYHVEAYIDACLARVARMPEGECEVLLVDDCGSDGSAAIASAYAQQHTNFRVIRREKNGGLSAARNTGFCEAKGEYVYFLDSKEQCVFKRIDKGRRFEDRQIIVKPDKSLRIGIGTIIEKASEYRNPVRKKFC